VKLGLCTQVRKRPLNRKETARKEEDIVTIEPNRCSLTVHEPKLKVDFKLSITGRY
jgi:hypothetical protein